MQEKNEQIEGYSWIDSFLINNPNKRYIKTKKFKMGDTIEICAKCESATPHYITNVNNVKKRICRNCKKSLTFYQETSDDCSGNLFKKKD